MWHCKLFYIEFLWDGCLNTRQAGFILIANVIASIASAILVFCLQKFRWKQAGPASRLFYSYSFAYCCRIITSLSSQHWRIKSRENAQKLHADFHCRILLLFTTNGKLLMGSNFVNKLSRLSGFSFTVSLLLSLSPS